jgi:aryl-alcohol dehydrogenase-like predicted oxidoreductase/enamine deaminase RidA (YjgF/YER057c/UK114 family)
MVERFELAPGLEISRVVTGLWQVADLEREGGELDAASTAEAMRPYVDAGLTTFDMADHYGSAELIVGAYDGTPAPEALTKWVPKPGPLDRETVRDAVQLSLDRLQTDALDLLQFHSWNYWDPSYLDGLAYLRELCDEGLIRHLGMTNTDAAHMRMLLHSGVPVVSNQVCYSLLDRRPKGGLTTLCAEHDLALLAYGTLAGGFLSDRWLGEPEPERLETWSQMKYKRFVDAAGGWDGLQRVLRAARTVADRHDVSIANVACRYVLDQPGVAAIIVGARLGHSEHVAATTRLFELRLTDADRADLEAAMATLDSIPGDSGDEYRREPFLTASGDLSHHVDGFPPAYTVQPRVAGGQQVLSGTVWEDLAGFSRAVRRERHVWVSGTTATHRERLIGGDDLESQTHFVIDKIEGALQSVGARLEDVVRTRVYVRKQQDWERIARVHGIRFGAIQPANTLVVAPPIDDGSLVEIDAEALLPDA